MPDIDVSDVLFDTDIAGDPFQVIRRQTSVDNNGQTVITAQTLPLPGQPAIAGAIYPAGDNSLVREAAFQTQKNAITVVTTFRLRGASKDLDTGLEYQPDLIPYQGGFYQVTSLNDYSRYGAGFVEADCIQVDWQDPTTPKDEGDD